MSARWVVESPTKEVVEKINEIGLREAAKYYLTTPSTLSRWLKSQNYKRRSIYTKVEKAS